MDNFIKVYDDAVDEVSCKLLIEKFEDSHEYFQTIHQEDGDEPLGPNRGAPNSLRQEDLHRELHVP